MRKAIKKKSIDAMIAKILGLMEEKERNKEWLLEELKRNKIKFHFDLGTNSYEILKSAGFQKIKKILEILSDQEFEIKEVNPKTRVFHWFFTDIIGSSDPTMTVTAQAKKIKLLNLLIGESEIFKKRDKETTAILPTGDGMAIGFTDSSESPLKLSIELHKKINRYNKNKSEKEKIFIRIGIDTGPVYFIKGIEGTKIFWGPGIIIARRVMDMCGPNQILASSRIADDLRNLTDENKATMQSIGSFTVKHGLELEIFNIVGHDFGSKQKIKPPKTEEKEDDHVGFEFNNVQVLLDVKDPKTWMTHHTWIWDVKNISNMPLVHIFYDVGGDTPKNFADMNVRITDNNKNRLNIISLDVNRAHEKKFYVRLNRPLKKNQSVQLKLEYDWEEPERVFEYSFSSKCHKFKYQFSIPRKIEIKNRILEVVGGLGIKKRIDPPPVIKYRNDKTIVTWESDKHRVIKPHDILEFQW